MEKRKRVLFVCIESACRSQMAEDFFNALVGGRAVAKSAGNKPAEKVHLLAVKVMRESGIDISEHKPKLITSEMIEEAEEVVLMGCGRDACPIVLKKVEDWHIEDPVGKGIEKFREVRDFIRNKVEELLVKLEVKKNES